MHGKRVGRYKKERLRECCCYQPKEWQMTELRVRLTEELQFSGEHGLTRESVGPGR